MRCILFALVVLTAGVASAECPGGKCAVNVLRGTKHVVTHPVETVRKTGVAVRNGVRKVVPLERRSNRVR